MSLSPAPPRPTIAFLVSEMSDGQAARTVMHAVREMDSAATVRVDLLTRRVEIEPTHAEPSDFRKVIVKAGYSAVRQWPADSQYL